MSPHVIGWINALHHPIYIIAEEASDLGALNILVLLQFNASITKPISIRDLVINITTVTLLMSCTIA
jgi:hypothetical protein